MRHIQSARCFIKTLPSGKHVVIDWRNPRYSRGQYLPNYTRVFTDYGKAIEYVQTFLKENERAYHEYR